MVQPIRPDPFLRARQEDRGGGTRSSTPQGKAGPLDRKSERAVTAVDEEVQDQQGKPLKGMPNALIEADEPIWDQPLGRPFETFSQLYERETIEQELQMLESRMAFLTRKAYERNLVARAHVGLSSRYPELTEPPTAYNAGVNALADEIRSIKERIDLLQKRYHVLQRDIRRNRRKYTGRPARIA